MKKKLAALLLILFITAVFAGCAQAPVLELSDHLPWANEINSMFYEKTEYTVIRKDSKDNIIAEGVLTFELDKVKKNANEYEDIFRLYTKIELKFFDDGLTDIQESEVYFTSYFLTPIKSDKTVKYESTADYGSFKIGPESSYNYSAVYQDSTIQGVEYKAGATGKIGEKDLTMKMSAKKAGSVDNEYLFFYMRALKNLKESSSVGFSSYNVYLGLNNQPPTLTKTPLGMSVAKNPVDFGIDSSLVSVAGDSQNTFMGVDNAVKAYKVTLAIQATNKGTDIILYYSQPKSESVSVLLNNRKILLGMETTELSQNSSKLAYSMSYKLKSYTNSPTV